MKLSMYNNLADHADGTILHNLVSGAMLLLHDASLKAYRQLQKGDFSNARFVDKLKTFGFIVKDVDERIALREVYDQRANTSKHKHIFVVTTDRCNLGCYYCYEEKKQWLLMSEETQEQTKQFIERMITGSPTTSFGVCWFGGEPTLNMEAIENIGKFTLDLCNRLGVKYHQFIVTNGTTLSEQVIDRLFDLEIKNFQITVDGFKEDHDRSRPYLQDIEPERATPAQEAQLSKIGLSLPILGQRQKTKPARSSYDSIMQGVGRLVEKGATISMRMNVNADNIQRCVLMLEEIKKQGWFEKNEKGGFVYVYANPIFEPDVGEKQSDSECSTGCGSCSTGCGSSSYKMMSKADFAKEHIPIRKWFKDNNIGYFLHYREMRFIGDTCTANKLHEFIVNPDGTLVKCTHHAGNPDRAIGHVRDLDPNPNSKDMSDSFHKFHPFEDQECRDCSVLPICLGGCKSSNIIDRDSKGEFDSGCITARYNLLFEIQELYDAKKDGQEKKDFAGAGTKF